LATAARVSAQGAEDGGVDLLQTRVVLPLALFQRRGELAAACRRASSPLAPRG